MKELIKFAKSFTKVMPKLRECAECRDILSFFSFSDGCCSDSVRECSHHFTDVCGIEVWLFCWPALLIDFVFHFISVVTDWLFIERKKFWDLWNLLLFICVFIKWKCYDFVQVNDNLGCFATCLLDIWICVFARPIVQNIWSH